MHEIHMFWNVKFLQFKSIVPLCLLSKLSGFQADLNLCYESFITWLFFQNMSFWFIVTCSFWRYFSNFEKCLRLANLANFRLSRSNLKNCQKSSTPSRNGKWHFSHSVRPSPTPSRKRWKVKILTCFYNYLRNSFQKTHETVWFRSVFELIY